MHGLTIGNGRGSVEWMRWKGMTECRGEALRGGWVLGTDNTGQWFEANTDRFTSKPSLCLSNVTSRATLGLASCTPTCVSCTWGGMRKCVGNLFNVVNFTYANWACSQSVSLSEEWTYNQPPLLQSYCSTIKRFLDKKVVIIGALVFFYFSGDFKYLVHYWIFPPFFSLKLFRNFWFYDWKSPSILEFFQ